MSGGVIASLVLGLASLQGSSAYQREGRGHLGLKRSRSQASLVARGFGLVARLWCVGLAAVMGSTFPSQLSLRRAGVSSLGTKGSVSCWSSASNLRGIKGGLASSTWSGVSGLKTWLLTYEAGPTR